MSLRTKLSISSLCYLVRIFTLWNGPFYVIKLISKLILQSWAKKWFCTLELSPKHIKLSYTHRFYFQFGKNNIADAFRTLDVLNNLKWLSQAIHKSGLTPVDYYSICSKHQYCPERAGITSKTGERLVNINAYVLLLLFLPSAGNFANETSD